MLAKLKIISALRVGLVKETTKNKGTCNHFTRSKATGFTLSEILLVLSVIGVVAALTIPTLTSNIQQTQFNTGIKNAYSLLSRAIIMIQANNGGAVHAGIGNYNDIKLKDEFCSVLSCIKSGFSETIFNAPRYYNYKSSTYSTTICDGCHATILNNGSFMYFQSAATCTGTVNTCGHIAVDLNGNQPPNMWGIDLYRFWIAQNNGAYTILPYGTSGDGTSCAAGAGATNGCTYPRLITPDSMP